MALRRCRRVLLLVTVLALALHPAQPFYSRLVRKSCPDCGHVKRIRTTALFDVARRKTRISSKSRKAIKLNWDTMIDRLALHYQTYGHSLVTKEHNDEELLQWTKIIRSNYRNQVLNNMDDPLRPRLSSDQIEALETLDFVWDTKGYMWKIRFDELCAFYAQHGHCRVPVEGKKLGIWVNNQRNEYRKMLQGENMTTSKLTPERLEALMGLGFFDSYRPRASQWELRYKELVGFQSTYGHAQVPEDYADNFELGQWVMNQRSEYKRYLAGQSTSLTRERVDALERLGFCWNTSHYNWLRMLERFKQFQQENRHCRVDPKDVSNRDLRLWIITQRHQYNQLQRESTTRKSPMTQQRIEALEQVPGFSWTGRNETLQKGPSVDDWAKLFKGIREKGITPGSIPKQHWFEGQNINEQDIKDAFTEEDLMDLWNQEEDDDDDFDDR